MVAVMERQCPICLSENPKVIDTRSVVDRMKRTWAVLRIYECPRGHRAHTQETVILKDDRREAKR
jgi:transcriptional regulator NrdR family protein